MFFFSGEALLLQQNEQNLYKNIMREQKQIQKVSKVLKKNLNPNPNQIFKNLSIKTYVKNLEIAEFFLISKQILQEKQFNDQMYSKSFKIRPQTYILKTVTKKIALIVSYLCLIIQPIFDDQMFKNKDVTNLRNIAKNHFGWRFYQENYRNYIPQNNKNIVELLQINIDTIMSNMEMISKIFSDISQQRLIDSIITIKDKNQKFKIIKQANGKKISQNSQSSQVFQIKDTTTQNSLQKIGIFKQAQGQFVLCAIFFKQNPIKSITQQINIPWPIKKKQKIIQIQSKSQYQNFKKRIKLEIIFIALILLSLVSFHEELVNFHRNQKLLP